MKYILIFLFLFLICGAVIKLIKKATAFIISFIVPILLSLFFDIPYYLGVIICSVFKFIIVDIFNSFSIFIKKLFLSKNKFIHNFLGKLVYILLNINYFIFILICYYNLLIKCLNAGSIKSYEELFFLGVVIFISRLTVRFINKKLIK